MFLRGKALTVVQTGFEPFVSKSFSASAFQVFGTIGIHLLSGLQMTLYELNMGVLKAYDNVNSYHFTRFTLSII